MEQAKLQVQLRWSDLDPNFHIRHSIYYDWGAMARIAFFNQHGITPDVMMKLHFGPIIFREECIFRKEIRSGDEIFIDARLLHARKDYSRFSIRHRITRGDGTLCAELTVDIAWLDTRIRKLATPPVEITQAFDKVIRHEEFKWSN